MNITNFFNPDDILGRAVLSLLLLALLTAPMGCFIVWRKMSYFGATLSHSAILGAIIGIVSGIGVTTGVIGFTVILAIFLSLLLHQRQIAIDTVLGMMAHFTLAISVVLISIMDNLQIDLMSYLLGDILSISKSTLVWLTVLSIFGVFLIVVFYKGFLNITINKEIAQVEGYSIKKLEAVFMVSLALTISIGMLAIGILLIIAILIIPAATARLFAKSAISMIFVSFFVTVLSIFLGVYFAYLLNLPAGASIVCFSGFIFLVSLIINKLIK